MKNCQYTSISSDGNRRLSLQQAQKDGKIESIQYFIFLCVLLHGAERALIKQSGTGQQVISDRLTVLPNQLLNRVGKHSLFGV